MKRLTFGLAIGSLVYLFGAVAAIDQEMIGLLAGTLHAAGAAVVFGLSVQAIERYFPYGGDNRE